MIYPEYDEITGYVDNYGLIPVCMEVYADMETPISIYKRYEEDKNSFLLESVEGGEKWARYSFIGINPFLVATYLHGEMVLEYRTGEKEKIKGNPLYVLKSLVSQYKAPEIPGMPRFCGGAVGYFTYDMIRYIENLPSEPEDDMLIPDCQLVFTDEVIAFDHLKQKLVIIVNMQTKGNIMRNYNSCIQRLNDIYGDIISSRWKTEKKPACFEDYNFEKNMDFKSNVEPEIYKQGLEKARNYIKHGDIFQVVLSQRLTTSYNDNTFNVYRALRAINPSPYMFYLNFESCSLAGASPEMLVRVEKGIAETCPIAGTRKRGKTEKEDKCLEKELLNDEKEIAEHTMLVDLGRNDIGKISKFATVKVKDLMHVEKYSHVMHIVTTVQGEMKEELTGLDALAALIPAGTLSGAPKIRAMEIIDELETTKRGPYGGAVGYIGFNGNLDTCITIRTILFKEGKAYMQAGAGIVADSIPEKEHIECHNKLKALLKAFEEAGKIG